MCWTVGGERLRGYKRRRWWTTVGWMCDWLLNKWMEQKSVLPWYCGPTLTLALCRKLKRNGFMTCEQRWKAVRMYKSLHPLWQLSLRHQMQADGLVKQGPPRSSYARVSRVLTVWSCCWQWLASSPGNRLHLSSGRDQHLTKTTTRAWTRILDGWHQTSHRLHWLPYLQYNCDKVLFSLTFQWQISHELHYSCQQTLHTTLYLKVIA